MTIAELKQKLNEFDENLEIAGSGHFGERLDIYDPYLCNEGFVVLEVQPARRKVIEVSPGKNNNENS